MVPLVLEGHGTIPWYLTSTMVLEYHMVPLVWYHGTSTNGTRVRTRVYVLILQRRTKWWRDCRCVWPCIRSLSQLGAVYPRKTHIAWFSVHILCAPLFQSESCDLTSYHGTYRCTCSYVHVALTCPTSTYQMVHVYVPWYCTNITLSQKRLGILISMVVVVLWLPQTVPHRLCQSTV